jgi:hypothetical protein
MGWAGMMLVMSEPQGARDRAPRLTSGTAIIVILIMGAVTEMLTRRLTPVLTAALAAMIVAALTLPRDRG